MNILLLLLFYFVACDWDWEFSLDIDGGENQWKRIHFPCHTDYYKVFSKPQPSYVYWMTYNQLVQFLQSGTQKGFIESITATTTWEPVQIKGENQEYFILAVNDNPTMVNFTATYHCSDNPHYNAALDGFVWFIACCGFCCILCCCCCIILLILGVWTAIVMGVKKAMWGNEEFAIPETSVDTYSESNLGSAGVSSTDPPRMEDSYDTSGYEDAGKKETITVEDSTGYD